MTELSYISPGERALIVFLFYSPAVFAFIFGTIIGSLSNVIIYRMVYYRSIWSPPSHCGACGIEIPGYRNIPLLTWLIQWGRCSNCGAKFSSRYFWVELLSGLLYAIVVLWVYTIPSPMGMGFTVKEILTFQFERGLPGFHLPDIFGFLIILKGWIFATMLIILAMIDLEHMLLPDRITLPGILVGLAMFFIVPMGRPAFIEFSPGFNYVLAGLIDALVQSILGGFIGGGILFLFARFLPAGMGWGDVKLLMMIGVFVGVKAIGPAMFVGFVTGGIIGVILMALGRAGRKTLIPFGPFLSFGGFVGMLAGPQIWNWYKALF